MQWLAALQTDAQAFHTRLQHSVDPQGLIAPGRYSQVATGGTGGT
jgi:hypothetical protein